MLILIEQSRRRHSRALCYQRKALLKMRTSSEWLWTYSLRHIFCLHLCKFFEQIDSPCLWLLDGLKDTRKELILLRWRMIGHVFNLQRRLLNRFRSEWLLLWQNLLLLKSLLLQINQGWLQTFVAHSIVAIRIERVKNFIALASLGWRGRTSL